MAASPSRDPAHDARQPLGLGVLRQVADGARAQAADRQLRVLHGAEHDDRRARRLEREPAAELVGLDVRMRGLRDEDVRPVVARRARRPRGRSPPRRPPRRRGPRPAPRAPCAWRGRPDPRRRPVRPSSRCLPRPASRRWRAPGPRSASEDAASRPARSSRRRPPRPSTPRIAEHRGERERALRRRGRRGAPAERARGPRSAGAPVRAAGSRPGDGRRRGCAAPERPRSHDRVRAQAARLLEPARRALGPRAVEAVDRSRVVAEAAQTALHLAHAARAPGAGVAGAARDRSCRPVGAGGVPAVVPRARSLPRVGRGHRREGEEREDHAGECRRPSSHEVLPSSAAAARPGVWARAWRSGEAGSAGALERRDEHRRPPTRP